jgi:hypothetical protein
MRLTADTTEVNLDPKPFPSVNPGISLSPQTSAEPGRVLSGNIKSAPVAHSTPPSNDAEIQKEKDLISDDEIRELIKPELFTLNIPAVMEILFGLFLFFIAIIKLNLGLTYISNEEWMNFAYGNIAEGTAFIGLMIVSFFVAYTLILKKNYAPIIGAGKGLFFIGYFLYGIFEYSRLAQGVALDSNSLVNLGYLTEKSYYEANMYANIMLLLFVLLLTLAMFYLLHKQGYLKKIFLRRDKTKNQEDTST